MGRDRVRFYKDNLTESLTSTSGAMYASTILVALLGFVGGHGQISDPGACLRTPRSPLHALHALTQPSECGVDSDCQPGAQCCYSGYYKKCIFPDPCQKVTCKDGHICQPRETPCWKPPCRLEATCLPASEVLCVPPVCNSTECAPGFEHVKGIDGCRTCECLKKKKCGTNCNMFCAHGFELNSNGCPVCSCRPEPESPCSNKRCERRHECRFVEVACKRAPCLPVAMCARINPVPYENACSLTDRTTIGLPVLNSTGEAELDCSSQMCPGHTVCTSMGRAIKRCCWQSTQLQTVSAPKPGDCPLMRNSTELTDTCHNDESCDGDQKCCFVHTDGNFSNSSGFCISPVFNFVKVVPSECTQFTFVRIILNLLGFC